MFCICLSDLKSRAAVAVERLSCKCLAVAQSINFNSSDKGGGGSASDLNDEELEQGLRILGKGPPDNMGFGNKSHMEISN